jgi:hypothetical protein
MKRTIAYVSVTIGLTLALSSSGCFQSGTNTSGRSEENQGDHPPGKGSNQKVGLLLKDPRAFEGYTLLVPMISGKTYLLDMQGKVVGKWESDCYPGLSAYLLENGHLLRTGALDRHKRPFSGPGIGGRIQEFTWEGELVWDFTFSNAKQLPHHDIAILPNGNVLMIVWEIKTVYEIAAAGRKPQPFDGPTFRVDCIIEIKPTGKTTGEIVWEWHAWDHLVQDDDWSKANYGDVAKHPERIDLNFEGNGLAPLMTRKDEIDKLRSIGYLRSAAGYDPGWTHINSVAYNPELDQIVLSVLGFNEIWIIDHSTTTAQAASHAGGRGGKGGDLLYRWGNPLAYRAGASEDQQLFWQHCANWIQQGLPGAGHVLVFDNGYGRRAGKFSSVEEIVPPIDANGTYIRKPETAFGPEKPVWSYTAPKPTEFFSRLLSSAQRLGNGNTLICSGMGGRIFEVTSAGEIVWDYQNPPHVGFPEVIPGLRQPRPGPAGSSVFCAWRYAPSFPGLAGKVLTSGKSVEELEPNAANEKAPP